nr:hypothetical protein [Marinicella sp. W31]MDC2876925.1 hypothetical protein [Marinicella sp. W31]
MSPDGSIVAIAIENERDEDLNDGVIPQMPAGDLVIIALKDGAADCATTKHVAMTGFAEMTAPSDPEPEFIDINDDNEIVVTLQENNGLVIVDGNTGEVKNHFSAGTVDLTGIDTEKDGKLDFTGSLTGIPREPDTVKWLDNDRFVIANEGDYKGGSRGFSIFSDAGELLYEAGASFERAVAAIGHFLTSVRARRVSSRKASSPARLATKTTFSSCPSVVLSWASTTITSRRLPNWFSFCRPGSLRKAVLRSRLAICWSQPMRMTSDLTAAYAPMSCSMPMKRARLPIRRSPRTLPAIR